MYIERWLSYNVINEVKWGPLEHFQEVLFHCSVSINEWALHTSCNQLSTSYWESLNYSLDNQKSDLSFAAGIYKLEGMIVGEIGKHFHPFKLALLLISCPIRKLKRYCCMYIAYWIGPIPAKVSCWWYCWNYRYFYCISFGYGQDSSSGIHFDLSLSDRDRRLANWSTRVLGIASRPLSKKKVLVVFTGKSFYLCFIVGVFLPTWLVLLPKRLLSWQSTISFVKLLLMRMVMLLGIMAFLLVLVSNCFSLLSRRWFLPVYCYESYGNHQDSYAGSGYSS